MLNETVIDTPCVTLSPKYQVVIPKDVREGFGLSPGDSIEVLALDGRIELIPVRAAKELRGFLKHLNNNFEREEDQCLS